MKITIKKKIIGFSFYLPNSFLKRVINKAIDEGDSSLSKEDFTELIKIAATFSKKHGHFDLINISTSDGYKVKIRI